jgi:hypothetical protein
MTRRPSHAAVNVKAASNFGLLKLRPGIRRVAVRADSFKPTDLRFRDR